MAIEILHRNRRFHAYQPLGLLHYVEACGRVRLSRFLKIRDPLEFRQDVRMELRQMPDDPGISEKSANVASREHQIEMIRAIPG